MIPKSIPLTERPEWRELQGHYNQIKDVRIRELFAGDPERGERMALRPVTSILTIPRTASQTTRSGCC